MILGAIGLGQWIMLAAILTSCILLILIILIQRGRGEGLSGAFGGGGGSSAFGAKTGDVFTGITVALAAVFLLLNIFGNYIFLPAGASPAPTVRSAPPPTPSQTPAMPAPTTDTPLPTKTEEPATPIKPALPASDTSAITNTETGATGSGDAKTPDTESDETP